MDTSPARTYCLKDIKMTSEEWLKKLDDYNVHLDSLNNELLPLLREVMPDIMRAWAKRIDQVILDELLKGDDK